MSRRKLQLHDVVDNSRDAPSTGCAGFVDLPKNGAPAHRWLLCGKESKMTTAACMVDRDRKFKPSGFRVVSKL